MVSEGWQCLFPQYVTGFYWLSILIYYMFTEYDRQQWIEGINEPIWLQVFASQNADVFVPDLCILDSELQCLVLYCVLLGSNYSVWFCTVYS
jgi:hypothetical protein